MTQWVEGATPAIDRESQWRPIVGICIAFTALMIITVAARFWLRRHHFYSEDWVTAVTAIFSIMYNIGTIIQTRYGLGLPLKQRPKVAFHKFIVWNYAIRPTYLWGIAGFKLALCLSYLRMVQGTSAKKYRMFIIAVATFSTVAQTVFVFLNLFSCTPLAKMFNPQIHGSCLPYGPVNYTISATTILSDVIIFLTPIPLIHRLRLDRMVKIGLSFIFCLGLFTTICSILRMTQIWRIAYGDGNSSLLVMYSALEINVGIITSSLPVLRPLLKHVPQAILSIVLTTRQSHTRPSKPEQRNDSYTINTSSTKSDGSQRKNKSTFAQRMFSSGVEKVTTSLGDGDSEEEILSSNDVPLQENPKHWKGDGVMRTVEIDVESRMSAAEAEKMRKASEFGIAM